MEAWEKLKKELHLDPLEPRTWDCRPLVVVSLTDSVVAFQGNTPVQVTPHSDGTADLVADGDRDGWHPSLVNAKVQFVRATGVLYGRLPLVRMDGPLHPAGLRCRGRDAEGFEFTWHINGAADEVARQLLDGTGPILGSDILQLDEGGG